MKLRPLPRRILVLNRFIHVVVVLAFVPVALAQDPLPPSRKDEGTNGSVLSVELSLDGKTLISTSRDHTIKIWDVATGELKQTLTNHTADVYCTTLSHDGKLMASADSKIILWDARTLEPIRTLDGH